MSAAEELAELEMILGSLKEAMTRARTSLIDEAIGERRPWDIHAMRDTNGRFILADVYTSYANAYVAWLNLKNALAFDPFAHSDLAKVSVAAEPKKPCEGKNVNVCVAEGCFGAACVDKEQ